MLRAQALSAQIPLGRRPLLDRLPHRRSHGRRAWRPRRPTKRVAWTAGGIRTVGLTSVGDLVRRRRAPARTVFVVDGTGGNRLDRKVRPRGRRDGKPAPFGRGGPTPCAAGRAR